MERNGQGDLSFTAALERVLEASQKVILNRLDLLKIEVQEDLAKSVRGVTFIGAGLVLAVGGWFFFMVLVVHWLDGFLPHAASLAIVGGLQALLGVILCAYGVQALRTIRLMKPDDGEPAYPATTVEEARPS
jgi:uncharacterized membrane protein YqjE